MTNGIINNVLDEFFYPCETKHKLLIRLNDEILKAIMELTIEHKCNVNDLPVYPILYKILGDKE